MKDFNIDRESILIQAVKDCYREMFAKAQPSADWDNLIQEYKEGKIDEEKDGPVYDRHYLSYHEYVYIINKYIEAYKIKSGWNDHIDLLKEYLIEGGAKETYIDEHTDENGYYHPGYRGYERVKPVRDQIFNALSEDVSSGRRSQLADYITKIVIDTIDTCQNFYSFNMDECKFRNTLAMGATPTSNAETVKKWWKDHYDVDVEIDERNPLLLWEYDNYGDQMDEIMTNDYGENWEQTWWDKYHKEEAEKKAKSEEVLKIVKNKN